MKTAQHHFDEIMQVANRPPPPVELGDNRSVIHRSWARCVNAYRLDPTDKWAPQVEAARRLREIRDELGVYLRIAHAGIEQLYKEAGNVGYVLLTDADGVVVDYLGKEVWDPGVHGTGLLPGANWHERYAGTNGIGTCLCEQTPVTCDRDQHFYSANLALSCDSVPLLDGVGKFMGVLNVSTLQTPSSKGNTSLAQYLTRLYGQIIESASFVQHFRDQWVLRLGSTWELLEVCAEVLLAIDADGAIVGANSGAQQQLRTVAGEDRLIGRHITEIFRCSSRDLYNLLGTRSSFDQQKLKTYDNRVFCTSIIPPSRPSTSSPRLAKQTEKDDSALTKLAGQDQHMSQLIDQARRLVDSKINILIQGETGTGKELLARALHDSSNRADKSFVAVNCAAMPESLIESEFFGYAEGTFTGGRSKGKKGLILQSDGGTLFLDEIGDMPLNLQTRLLRVLSEQEVLPLGASHPIPIDLTVISASHRDLRTLIAEKTFREDLFYRLCGATLALPPLRARQDQKYIVSHVLAQEARQMGKRMRIGEEAMAVLLRQPWPGNIRQLRNAVRFALAIATGETIEVEHLPLEIRSPGEVLQVPDSPLNSPAYGASPNPAANVADDPAAQELLTCLRSNKWNITAVACELQLCRSSVYRRMKRFGIVAPNQA